MQNPEKEALICNAHCMERYESTPTDVVEVDAVLRENGYGIGRVGCLGVCNLTRDNRVDGAIVNLRLTNAEKGWNESAYVATRVDDGIKPVRAVSATTKEYAQVISQLLDK